MRLKKNYSGNEMNKKSKYHYTNKLNTQISNNNFKKAKNKIAKALKELKLRLAKF